MQQDILNEKIIQCLKVIFSFSLSRTGNRQEAEDLSQEIVSELFRSAHTLRDEKAFYGWMWAIANNVYKVYLRKIKKSDYSELDEGIHASFNEMPEPMLVENEEINLLRRELSILSRQYRIATIKYYIENKSCSQISQELDISVDMVKYLLFKARKILKEGMDMTRKYGEKSYNPDIFNIDYWGNGSNEIYRWLFERKLPGNILLSAYYEPLTVEEISLELGVAAPYVEDEFAILLKHKLIRQLQNGRYQTNIIIFTESCENEIYEKTKKIYADTAERLNDFISKSESEIRGLGFYGSEFSKNRLLWLASHTALWNGMQKTDSEYHRSSSGYPILSNGSHGYLWGLNRSFDTHLFNGIYGFCFDKLKSSWLHVCNYKVIEKCQLYHPDDKEINLLIDAAKNSVLEEEHEEIARLISDGYISNDGGKYNVNFPVFTEDQYKKLQIILQPVIDEISESIKKVIAIAVTVLRNHAPAVLKEQYQSIAHICNQMSLMGYIIEEMCTRGYLFVPKVPEKLTMFIVLKN